MWLVPEERSANYVGWLVEKIEKVLAARNCRFTAGIRSELFGRRPAVRITTVRLRNSKDFCGQHPAECAVNLNFERPHRCGRWLEGADWVGFLDGLNDLLDSFYVTADMWSYNREAGQLNSDGRIIGVGRFYARIEQRRRIVYGMDEVWRGGRPIRFWTPGTEAHFFDWCGRKAPRSEFPDGTPGMACWTLREEKAWQTGLSVT